MYFILLCGSVLAIYGPAMSVGSQLLFLPLSERTHMLVSLRLALSMVSRGHGVYFMTADCHADFAAAAAARMDLDAARSLAFVPYAMNCTAHEVAKAAARKLNPAAEAAAIVGNVLGRADDMLSDERLDEQLRSLSPPPDLLVSDVLAYGMLLAARYQLPHVDLDVGTAGALWEPVFYGADPATSYVPAVGTLHPTHGMTLLQRAVNLVAAKAARGALAYTYWGRFGGLQRLLRRHGLSLPWPYASPLLLLVNSNFVLEPPRAIPPNIKYVGPVLPAAPAPLPDTLRSWLDGATAGAVLVSFGGTLSAPLSASITLAAVMRAMPGVRFVWKLTKAEAAQLSPQLAATPNVLVQEWLPQNDVLGHPALTAFVSQGGYLSMAEAAYHGVPVLGVPFIPGQAELVRYAADEGRALLLPAATLTGGDAAAAASAVEAALTKLLREARFTRAAAVTATRLRAVREPYAEQAADWVEYALAVRQHGPFLYPAKLHQRWHEQVMLDVALLYAVVAAAAVLCVGAAGRRLQQQRRRRRQGLRSSGRRAAAAAAGGGDAAARRGPGAVTVHVKLRPASPLPSPVKKCE
jgi:UDP:flavonoid glycosyltransferase YjiC (YdhE family)